ncbi:hypothetical protein B484DRAFT_406871 [Ochromonadaceae sp. CCMP2298]|nr:hypothetical protein B484DRAFT_406871 [Ochromonadaceae sp. CCMP2298]
MKPLLEYQRVRFIEECAEDGGIAGAGLGEGAAGAGDGGNAGYFKEKLGQWKEILNRKKKTVGIADLRKEVYNELRRIVVVVEVDRTKELRILLLPITADDVGEDFRLDIICDMPAALDPVKVTFTKLVSATEILRAKHLLNAEREKLVHALHQAELFVAYNFTLIVKAKRRLEQAMLSQPRLRWIKAINQVLVLNYVEKTRARVLRSNCAAWYQALPNTTAIPTEASTCKLF